MATITTLPAFPLRDLYCFQPIGIRLPDSELTTVCVCGAANEACSAVARSVAIQILLEILVVLSAKTFCLEYRHTANIASAKTKEPFSAVLACPRLASTRLFRRLDPNPADPGCCCFARLRSARAALCFPRRSTENPGCLSCGSIGLFQQLASGSQCNRAIPAAEPCCEFPRGLCESG